MAYRVLLGNHKGGAGKTTAAVNLAAGLAQRGARVLVVDMDPQANVSRRLGAAVSPETPTVSEAIRQNEIGVAAAAVTGCGWEVPWAERISVLPARFDLENRISEAGTVGAVSRLARVLRGVDDDQAVTLIDCPPSLGHLVQMSMAAAHGALVAIEPEYDGVEGAVRLRDFVGEYGEAVGSPELRVIGALVCRVRQQLGAHAFQIEGLVEGWGDLLWKPYVPEAAVQKDASDAAAPLSVYGRRGAELAEIWDQHAVRLLEAAA